MSHRVDTLPREWAAWSFGAKVAWLQGHSAPRMEYRAACRWLANRSAIARAARAERARPVASRQEVDRG